MVWITIGGLVASGVVWFIWRAFRNIPVCTCGRGDCEGECIDWQKYR